MSYVAHLVRGSRMKKRIEFSASSTSEALSLIKQYYKGWDISMFWPVWIPEPKKEG